MILQDGQQLPGASEWQISAMAVARLPYAWDPTITLSHRYLTDAPQSLQTPDLRINGFGQTDPLQRSVCERRRDCVCGTT